MSLTDFFEKLIEDAIELLRLIHVQPVAGTGDHLVRQVRHKPVQVVWIVLIGRDDGQLWAAVAAERRHGIVVEDGLDKPQRYGSR